MKPNNGQWRQIALLLLAFFLSASAVLGQADHLLIDGRYLWQVREPDGTVIVEDKEFLNNSELRIEKWRRGMTVVTQTLEVAVSKRVDANVWRDTLHYYVEWPANGAGPLTNESALVQRGFSWAGSSGAGVWQTSDGRRYLQISSAAFKVFWKTMPLTCYSNQMDNGCAARSVFRYMEFPVVQAHYVNLATCTIGTLEPEAGATDNREAYVKIPIDPARWWKWFGREECYYCIGDQPCWFWDSILALSPPVIRPVFQSSSSPSGAGAGIVSVSLPAPDGVSAQIWRSTDLKSWALLGTVVSENGQALFTDTNAPQKMAFYILAY